MFIPVAVGLLDSNGKDLPLTSVYNGESLQSLTSEGHSVSTVILRIEKVWFQCFKALTAVYLFQACLGLGFVIMFLIFVLFFCIIYSSAICGCFKHTGIEFLLNLSCRRKKSLSLLTFLKGQFPLYYAIIVLLCVLFQISLMMICTFYSHMIQMSLIGL
jgi:hypothetical protein